MASLHDAPSLDRSATAGALRSLHQYRIARTMWLTASPESSCEPSALAAASPWSAVNATIWHCANSADPCGEGVLAALSGASAWPRRAGRLRVSLRPIYVSTSWNVTTFLEDSSTSTNSLPRDDCNAPTVP